MKRLKQRDPKQTGRIFAERIRKHHKGPYEALAFHAGVPFTTLINWIRTGAPPNLDNAKKIAVVMGYSLDYLTGITNNPDRIN